MSLERNTRSCVLTVETDPDITELIRIVVDQLEPHVNQFLQASTPQQADAMLDQCDPNVVIADLDLDNSWTVIRGIRGLRKLGIPIVGLATELTDIQTQACRQLKIDVLPKPFNIDDLSSKLSFRLNQPSDE